MAWPLYRLPIGMMMAGMASVVMPVLGRNPRCLQIVLGQYLRRWSPGHKFPCHQQALRKMPKHLISIMQHRDDRAVLLPPTLNYRKEIGGGALIDGGEWLVEKNHL